MFLVQFLLASFHDVYVLHPLFHFEFISTCDLFFDSQLYCLHSTCLMRFPYHIFSFFPLNPISLFLLFLCRLRSLVFLFLFQDLTFFLAFSLFHEVFTRPFAPTFFATQYLSFVLLFISYLQSFVAFSRSFLLQFNEDDVVPRFLKATAPFHIPKDGIFLQSWSFRQFIEAARFKIA